MPRDNTTKGANPFDRFVAPKDLARVAEVRKKVHTQELDAAHAEIQRQTQAAFLSGQRYKEAWSEHQERRHLDQLREAEAVVPVEVRQELQANQIEQDRLDDERFSWVHCYDQLLQIRDHEEYLRAHRSFERRLQHAKETGEPIPEPWTGGRVWAWATGIVFVVLMLGAAKESILGAIILAVIGLPVWAILVRLPATMGGFDTTGRGGSNAV